jgi:hypothetical protein
MTTAPSYLPPVAFHQHIPPMPVNPAMAHPNGVGMWWTLPAAGRPDVRVSVPLMVSTDPDIARTGRCDSCLNNLSGRPDLHDDFFRMKRTNTHCYRKQRRGQKFTHVQFSFHISDTYLTAFWRRMFHRQNTESINKNTLGCLKKWQEGAAQ